MEQIINVVVQNGLGVASFIALIWFMNTSLKDMNKTMSDIAATLIQIQLNLSQLNGRVDDLEEKNNKSEVI
jgi:uncharacterized protein YoxC